MAASDEVDLELIGALMDGRLTGAERERAIKLLGSSEAAFEIYAHALRARADLNEVKVVPIASVRRQHALPWQTIGSVAAAAILMIAVLPVTRATRDRRDLAASAGQITIALARRPDLSRTLTGDWDQRTWSVTRGENARLADTTIAFRLGVRAVDLNVALAAHDTARADRLMAEMIESLDGVMLSNSVKARYEALRAQQARGATSEPLEVGTSNAERELVKLLDPFWFAFGRWVGAGELAARTETKAFFADPRTTHFLELASRRREVSPADAELLGQIAARAGKGGGDVDFGTIRQHFLTLIRRHGG
jgi:hypothetical protein